MKTLVGSFPHNTLGKQNLIAQTILLSLVYVSIILRLWSRRLQRVSFQVNDYLILVATFLMTGRYIVDAIVVLKTGLGLHVAEVVAIAGPDIMIEFSKLAYADNLLWITLVAMIKLSILDFYIKVFRTPNFVRAAYFVMFLCVGFWFGVFFTTAFFCNPPRKYWHQELPGRCGDSRTFYTASMSTDLLIDVFVILLPMPVLWNLQMPLARKIALMGVFALGFTVTFITLVSIKFIKDLENPDPTYGFAKLSFFISMVPLLGIINANILLMQPAFKRIFGSSILEGQQKSSGGGAGHTWQWSRKKGHASGFNESQAQLQFGKFDEPEIPLVRINSSDSGANRGNLGGILVTTDWEIHSEDPPHHLAQNRA